MFDPTFNVPVEAISGGSSAASLSSFWTDDRSDDGGVDVCVDGSDVDPHAASPNTSSEVTSRRGFMAGTVQRRVEDVHKKLKSGVTGGTWGIPPGHTPLDG